MDQEFEFRAASRRGEDAEIVYHLTRKPWGWSFRSERTQGWCDKRGVPYLFDSLDQDGIEYPGSLRDRLRALWLEAHDKDLTPQEVQQALDRLAVWLRDVDEHAPAYEVRVSD